MNIAVLCLLLCTTLIERTAAVGESVPVYPPIKRILQNYEKHLLKLKGKFDTFEAKKRNPRERSIELPVDENDEAAAETLVESFDELRRRHSTAAPPGIGEHPPIGILSAPSTHPPAVSSAGRHWKVWAQHARKSAGHRFDPPTRNPMLDEEEPKEEDGKMVLVSSTTYRGHSLPDGNETVDLSTKWADEKKKQEGGGSPKAHNELRAFSLFDASSPPENKAEAGSSETSKPASTPQPLMSKLSIRRLDAKPRELTDNDIRHIHPFRLPFTPSFSANEDGESEEPFVSTPDLYRMEATSEAPEALGSTPSPNSIESTTEEPKVEATTVETTTLAFFPWQRTAFVTEAPTTEPPPTPAHLPTATAASKRRPPIARARGVATFPSGRREDEESRPLEAASLEQNFEFAARPFGHKRRGYGWLMRESGGLDYDEDEANDREVEELIDAEDEQLLPLLRGGRKFRPYRFGYRRKPIASSYLSDDDFDYLYARYGLPSRGSHRFPAMIQRSRALDLPSRGRLEAEDEAPERTTEREPKPTPPQRFSTIVAGIAGAAPKNAPADPSAVQHAVAEAPSPEEQRKEGPPPPRADLQMSRENCGKVNNYAKMFGVKDPQTWVRSNCNFVQAFVKAPCNDINEFVDSCYRFKL